MIESAEFQGKTLIFYNEDVLPDQNVFTAIVGKNGTGKSRLLRSIIERNLKSYTDCVMHGAESTDLPSNIIAVSLSPFDRFPLGGVMGFSKGDPLVDESKDFYFYQGLRGLYTSNHSLSYMTKIVGALIRAMSTEAGRLGTVLNALEYLGFNKSIRVNFICGMSRETLKRIADNDGFDDYLISNRRPGHELKRLMLKLEGAPGKTAEVIEAIRYYLDKFNGERVELPITEAGALRSLAGEPINELFATLLDYGVLKLRGVYLHKKGLNKEFKISDASSGEQGVVLTMLGIAARIKDGSLICIDEPEICLHPEWQERYIELLLSTFKNFKSCQFLITTHSPQIVSRLESENCFVLNLNANNLLNASDLNRRSIDFQLATVFNAPGHKNEYLMRELLAIVSKITRKVQLKNGDFEILSKAKSLKSNMTPSDPVLDLVLLLEEALDGGK
ncbi:AAA family ATPase [Metapseudomonas otitidis]|uniref:AAA family ATPase n=1 Tax=Metapseudomonas otitidis TaxID=319939 RepID=UPI00244A1B05|nr:ATP-binding protein [Pseudomonas otitidis]MDH0336160.1 ATP-binding protein [Pseudomonas otitidis]